MQFASTFTFLAAIVATALLTSSPLAQASTIHTRSTAAVAVSSSPASSGSTNDACPHLIKFDFGKCTQNYIVSYLSLDGKQYAHKHADEVNYLCIEQANSKGYLSASLYSDDEKGSLNKDKSMYLDLSAKRGSFKFVKVDAKGKPRKTPYVGVTSAYLIDRNDQPLSNQISAKAKTGPGKATFKKSSKFPKDLLIDVKVDFCE